jgi:hypothetical protein
VRQHPGALLRRPRCFCGPNAGFCAFFQVDVLNGLLPLLEESKVRAIEAATKKFGNPTEAQMEMFDRTYTLKREKIDHRIEELANSPDTGLEFVKKLAKDENATTITKEAFKNGMLKYIKEEVERSALKGYQQEDNKKKKPDQLPE